MRTLLTLLLIAVLISSASAHYIWLERADETSARAYYGYWHRGIHEKTGDKLDDIKATGILPADIAGASYRRDDHIEITTKAPGDVGLVEETGLRRARIGTEVTRAVALARAGRSQANSLVDLDLVPMVPDGNRFALQFQGSPLADTEITVYDPDRQEQKLTTNALGQVQILTPKAGQYLVRASHTHEQPGETAEGEHYDRTRYGLTLTFSNP